MSDTWIISRNDDVAIKALVSISRDAIVSLVHCLYTLVLKASNPYYFY